MLKIISDGVYQPQIAYRNPLIASGELGTFAGTKMKLNRKVRGSDKCYVFNLSVSIDH